MNKNPHEVYLPFEYPRGVLEKMTKEELVGLVLKLEREKLLFKQDARRLDNRCLEYMGCIRDIERVIDKFYNPQSK